MSSRRAVGREGCIDHFDWRPEDGTRLIVIDRAT